MKKVHLKTTKLLPIVSKNKYIQQDLVIMQNNYFTTKQCITRQLDLMQQEKYK